MAGTRPSIGCVIAAVVALAGLTYATFVGYAFLQRAGHHQDVATCQDRLRQVGGLLTSLAKQDGDFPQRGGAALLLGYRRAHLIQPGYEHVLICPGDKDARAPESHADQERYETVDATNAAAIAALCSYAVRDFARFPVRADGRDTGTGSGELAWIACDRQGKDGRTPHHENGINVLFADGAVQFMNRDALGIAPDEPIIVGPGSPHPELRKLVFVPALSPDGAEKR